MNYDVSLREEQGGATHRRWTIFLLSCGASFLLYLHRFTFNFIGPKLKEEFALNDTQVGAIGSLFNWTYGSLQVPSGIIADMFGPHLFLGVSIAIWSGALALHGAGGMKLLVFARLLFGASQAGTYPCLNRVTHSWFPARNRTMIQGWIATFCGRGGGFASSVLMGTVLMGWLELSWQQSLLWLSAIGLVFAVLFLVLFRSEPEHDPRVNASERALIRDGRSMASSDRRVLPWRSALANRSMALFVTQQFFAAGADGIYNLFMGGYFLVVKGVDLKTAGLFVGLPLLGGAVGGMLGGACNDLAIRATGSRRWGRTIIGATGNVLACCLMFLAITRDSAAAAGWSLFVVKFFSDWSQPTVWGACTDLGGRFSASIFSIVNTSGTLGGVLMPPIFGWILDRFATISPEGATIPGYLALFLCVAAMYLVSAVCWIGIDCSRPIEQ